MPHISVPSGTNAVHDRSWTRSHPGPVFIGTGSHEFNDRRRAGLATEDGAHHVGEPSTDVVGFLLAGSLDHDPDQWFGARRADEHAAAALQRCLLGSDRL